MIDIGTFTISVSDRAERLEFEQLTNIERECLLRGFQYDSQLHDIFRFMIAAIPVENRYKSKKTNKKRSFGRVNRAMILTTLGSIEIKVLGIFPTTTQVSGQQGLDLDGELVLEGYGAKLRASGNAKSYIRRKKFSILAGRTNSLATWIFLKPYLEENIDFPIEILCVAPRTLPNSQRHVVCQVTFSEDGRVIEYLRGRRIPLA